MTDQMPVSPPPPPTILSWVPGRNGRAYKMHDNIGHAKNAVVSGRGGKIFEWNGSEWKELYDVPAGLGDRAYWKENMPWNKEKTELDGQRKKIAQQRAARRAAEERMEVIKDL